MLYASLSRACSLLANLLMAPKRLSDFADAAWRYARYRACSYPLTLPSVAAARESRQHQRPAEILSRDLPAVP